MADHDNADNGVSPWSQYRRLVIAELERLGDELRNFNNKLDSCLLHLSALEDRTNGQRARLEAAERGYASISHVAGRIEDRQKNNTERLDVLERLVREQKPSNTQFLLGDPTIVKVAMAIFYMLVAAVLALVTGKAINLGG